MRDKYETINHRSEGKKLVKREFKTRHEWVGKGIHLELCNKLKYDYTTKWYMHNSKAIQENETHKILCDFEIQINHLIPARKPNLMIVKKKTMKEIEIEKEKKSGLAEN